MLKGVDISQHQATFPDPTGLTFAILRASIGSAAGGTASVKDTAYDGHFRTARDLGLVAMAYHFNGPSGSDLAAQASHFLAVAQGADFLWLDQETFRAAKDGQAAVPGFTDLEAQVFIDAIRKAGRPCGLYHQASGFGGVNADAKWVADWRPASVAAGFPRTTAVSPVEYPGWDVWQWSSKGWDGAGSLDVDYLNPDTTLAALFRRSLGYDPAIAAWKARIAELDAGMAAQFEQIVELERQRAVLEGQLRLLDAKLAEATGLEAERVAAAAAWDEANRIRRAAGYPEQLPPRELSRFGR